MTKNYLDLLILFVASLLIRTSYELLKDSGKIKPTNKIAFGIIFIVMCALWTSWFLLCRIDPLPMNLPIVIQWFGFTLFVIGTLLAVGALIQLRGLENINHLVTKGLFTKLQHPMYTGFILWILGWGIFYSAGASLIAGALAIANILQWKYLEEVRLHVKYGEVYEQYRKTTWF